MWRVLTCVIIMAIVLGQEATAQLSLSTPTDVQCYGRPVTLVCTHPVLPQEPEYLQGDVGWRRDGRGLRTSDSDFQTSTVNSTTTRLQFTIAENTTGNYTCFLVNLVQSRADESNSVSVRPLGPEQPTIKHIDCSKNTSITFNWTHTPMECYMGRISYYVSWVNTDNTTESGSNVTEEHMYNITDLVANGNYTISVWAVVDSVKSTADSDNVTTGQPEVVCGDQPACSERNFTLYCKISPVYEDGYININWAFNSAYINESEMYHISDDKRELEILNVESTTIGFYGCCIELKNGTFVEGMPYNLHPLGTPKPPLISVQTGISYINVSWEHDNSCFENYTFVFNVTWQKVDATSEFWSADLENGTTFNIQPLKPGTNYSICVFAVSTSDPLVKSDVCQYYRTQPIMLSTEPGDTIAIAAGTAVAVGVVIFIIPVLIILIACVVLQQMKRRAHSAASGIPESVSLAALERVGTEQPVQQQGGTRQVQDQPQTASQRATTEYAQLDFSGDRPVPAPPLEQVTYAEVENKPKDGDPVQKTDPPDGNQSGTVSNDGSELGGPVQESSPPDDNGKLLTTHPKEKIVGMIITENDQEPPLDHAAQEDSRNIKNQVTPSQPTNQ